MNPARPITNLVRRGMRRTCASRLGRRFILTHFRGGENVAQHWHDMLDHAGVELEQVVRVRPDGRGIFRVRHPQHGRCMLKTLFATRHPSRGLANVTIAELASRATDPIFPRVHVATPEYTLEAYIDGQPFREWMAGPAFDRQRVRDYLHALKAWSTSGVCWQAGAVMQPYEIREICKAYVGKCLGHSRYFSAAAQFRHLRRFVTARQRIAGRIQAVLDAAERVRLPRGMMCGDMGNINILVQRGSHRLYNIDYEFMGPGHHGFDCAYFISSLHKMGDPPARLDEIRAIVFAEPCLGDESCRAFFLDYTDLLCDISRTIYENR